MAGSLRERRDLQNGRSSAFDGESNQMGKYGKKTRKWLKKKDTFTTAEAIVSYSFYTISNICKISLQRQILYSHFLLFRVENGKVVEEEEGDDDCHLHPNNGRLFIYLFICFIFGVFLAIEIQESLYTP